jgi:hypothetical protein
MADDDKKRHRHWIEISQVVAMPIVTLVVGYLLNSSISTSQTRDSNLRLYADMMGRREEADSALRKDMFKSILDTFVSSSPSAKGEPEEQVLNLELLAYNFHESLDLGRSSSTCSGSSCPAPRTSPTRRIRTCCGGSNGWPKRSRSGSSRHFRKRRDRAR